MKYKFQKRCVCWRSGFTLIELLVVIAIIGILSGVVLASLNAARKKGQIANIKSNLRNMIPQTELSYDIAGNYSTVCTDTKITNMITAINNSGGTAYCYSVDGLRWAVSAKLNSDTSQNWTVDSNGFGAWDTVDKSVSDWATATTSCSSVEVNCHHQSN